MIDLVVSTSGYRRRMLAGGAMLELGTTSPMLHREAGRLAAGTGKIDWIVGVQGDAAEIVLGAIAEGHPESRTRFFPTSQEAAKFVRELVQPGGLLLVKGSRGVKMEQIVKARLAHRAPVGARGDTRENAGEAHH